MGNRVVLCVLVPEEGWEGQEGVRVNVVSFPIAPFPCPLSLPSPGLDSILVRAATILFLPHLLVLLPMDHNDTFWGSLFHG